MQRCAPQTPRSPLSKVRMPEVNSTAGPWLTKMPNDPGAVSPVIVQELALRAWASPRAPSVTLQLQRGGRGRGKKVLVWTSEQVDKRASGQAGKPTC